MADKRFKRGAKATPRYRLLAAPAFKAVQAVPENYGVIPPKLSMKGNDQYGDCVSAESAQAISVYSLACGLAQRFVTDQETINWARKHGVLDGALLPDVMDAMARDGMDDDASNLNKDGPYAGVDYSHAPTLNAATFLGPINIAIDANALPDTAGNQMGWFALQKGNFPNTDHCVHLSSYGRADFIFDLMKVKLPAQISASTFGRALYTWSTYGFVTDDWLAGTCVEAWLRNPTILGLPTPTPPVPPGPTPTPGGGIPFGQAVIFNQDGTYSLGGTPTPPSDAVVLSAVNAELAAFGYQPLPELPPHLQGKASKLSPQQLIALINVILALFGLPPLPIPGA